MIKVDTLQETGRGAGGFGSTGGFGPGNTLPALEPTQTAYSAAGGAPPN